MLVLTAAQDPIYLSEALKAGAAGYVQRGYHTGDHRGGAQGARRRILLDQELATQLLKRLMEDPKPEPNGCQQRVTIGIALNTRE